MLCFTPSPPHRSAGHVHPVFTEQAPHFIPPYFYSQSFLQVDFPPFYFLLLKFCLSRVHFKCHSTMKVPLSQLDVPSSSETGCVSFVLQLFMCMAYCPTSSQQTLSLSFASPTVGCFWFLFFCGYFFFETACFNP